MKKIFSTLITVLFFSTVFSQTLFIYKKNLSVMPIFTSDIDSIVFNGDSTSCPAAIDYDGHKYKTIKIGTQCWMAENLVSTHYSDGRPLIDVTSAGNISGIPLASYIFWYHNIKDQASVYGILYSWAAAMDSASSSSASPSGVQGVCPVGWHLPSSAEWDTLGAFVNNANGGTYTVTPNILSGYDLDSVGNKLKSTVLWGDLYPHNGTDNYGFDGRPGGHRGPGAYYDDLHVFGNWWSSTRISTPNVANSYSYRFNSSGQFIKMGYPENTGYSIRCVKN